MLHASVKTTPDPLGMKKAHGGGQFLANWLPAWARGNSRPTTAGPRRDDRSYDTVRSCVIVRYTVYMSMSNTEMVLKSFRYHILC